MPKVAELSQIACPRRVAAAGAPHTAAVRFRVLLVVVSRCAQDQAAQAEGYSRRRVVHPTVSFAGRFGQAPPADQPPFQ